jgi:hypothetical protein
MHRKETHSRLVLFWHSARSNLWGYTLVLIALLILWPVATFMGWIYSVAFVSHVSMAAFIVAVVACIETSRVEVKQEEEIDEEVDEGTM